MNDIYLRPFMESDREKLDEAKMTFSAAKLETPHGYTAPGVETAVALKGESIDMGEVMSSMTGTMAVVIDPFIKIAGFSDADQAVAITKMESVLTYLAQDHGAVDSYLAIPNGETEEEKRAARIFERFALRSGYRETIQNCKVFVRSLHPAILSAPSTGNEPIESGSIDGESQELKDDDTKIAPATAA